TSHLPSAISTSRSALFSDMIFGIRPPFDSYGFASISASFDSLSSTRSAGLWCVKSGLGNAQVFPPTCPERGTPINSTKRMVWYGNNQFGES
ncbi:MAG TPA: hypothetical protein PKE58_02450, partial [Acidobacteriota bacterium]|nr:hypothetical protein [Acidobacteriota bacterium]